MALLSAILGLALGEIRVGDLPGSHGSWQMGEVTVDAPADEVQRWLADISQWPARFADVESAQVIGSTPDGRRIVRFYSRIIGRTLTLRIHESPGLIVYDGEGKNVSTRGKIYIERVDARRTHVILQSTADVHGVIGLFATQKTKRERALTKLRSDLSAIVRLSRRT